MDADSVLPPAALVYADRLWSTHLWEAAAVRDAVAGSDALTAFRVTQLYCCVIASSASVALLHRVCVTGEECGCV